MLLGRGADGWSPRRAAGLLAGGLGVMIIVSGLHILGMARDRGDPSIRDFVRTVLAHCGQEATLLITEDQWKLLREFHRQGFCGRLIPYPARRARQLGWSDLDAELADPEALQADAAALASQARQLLADGRPVWLLTPGYEPPADKRLQVDRYLYNALAPAGIAVEPVGEQVSLARLHLAR